MQVVKIQEVSFTIASGASSGTGTLTGFSTLGKMICFATWRVADGQSPVLASMTEVDVWPNSTSQITAERWSNPSYAVNVRAYVIEFGSDTTVYKGTWAMTSSATAHTGISIGGTVTLADTFGWHYRKSEGEAAPANDSDPDGRYTAFHFSSTTQLAVNRNVAKGACQGHWFVVESSTLTVQHGDHTITGSSVTSTTDTITSVTTGETFIVSSYLTNETEYNDEGCWTTDLQNATTVRFRRSYAASVTNTWRYMVVSDSNMTVQRGEWTGTGTAENTTITSTDLTLSIAKSGSGRSGDDVSSDYANGNFDGRFNELWLNSATRIDRQTGDGLTGLIATWEVVEMDAAPSGPSISDVDTDEDIHDAQTGVVITGSDFETEGANSRVRINSSSAGSGTDSVQTDTSWADTSIQFSVVKGSLSYGTNYVFVRNQSLEENATGFQINLYDYLAISSLNKSTVRSGDSLRVNGEGFGSSQSSSSVQLTDTSTDVTQTIVSWNDTYIDITVVQGALDEDDTIYVRVDRNNSGLGDSGVRESNQYGVDLLPPVMFRLSASTQFDNKDPTTKQLTGTESFTAGEIVESSMPDEVDVGSDNITEYEFCIEATSDSAAGEQYEFRIADETQSGELLEEYDVTPKVTIAT